MAKGGIPLGELSGSTATDRLREVIEKNQKAADRQTATMIRLTWVMTALTVVTTILTIVTVVPIIRPWLFSP
jgi:predicted nucleic acid-binding Zn ribbon protein